MLKRAIVALVLRLTPRRWRDAIAGDLQEAPGGAGPALLHSLRVLCRLWLEEVWIAREKPMRQPVMPSMGVHLRQAVRSLVKRPAYSLIVIATLGIGIGATAAVFGLANWLLFRPLPGVNEPSRLATIRLAFPSGGIYIISHPEMEILRAHAPSILSIAGSTEASFNLASPGGDADRVHGGIVSANYFDVLGVRPFAGRMFSDGDPGVVISHAYWRTRMGAAPDAVGSTVLVNGQSQPVLGIAPRGFSGVTRTSSVDLWVPTTLRTMVFPGYGTDPLKTMSTGIYFELVARLAPDARIETLQAALDAAPAALGKIHPSPQRYKRAQFIADEGLSSRGFERERLSRTFSLLMAMVGMLLLLACANVGNVMLAANSARRSELATRQALGASRLQIVFGVFLESVLLALAGGTVAVALASAVSALMRGTIVLPYLPALGEISLDARVFGFALAVSTLSAVSAGLLPALSATRFDLISALKGAGRSVTQGGRRLRKTLAMAQVAVSLTLLVGALLLARSVHERRRVDLGFDPSPVMSFSVEPGLHGADRAKRLAFYDQLLERVASTPGVGGVATSWDRPFGRIANDGDIQAADGVRREPAPADIWMVSARYFETMGIRMLEGREFAVSDQAVKEGDRSTVVIVSLSLARHLFGSADGALGRTIKLHEDPLTIVGIAADARLRRAFNAPPHVLYRPFGRAPQWAAVHVRSRVPAAALAPAIRDAVRRADPTVPIYDMMTVREAIDRQMSEEIMIGKLAVVFALIAMLLAAVGLYGVLAQSVADRRVEIGIRAALGAAPARVLRLVTTEAGWMTAIGAAAGLGLAAWLSRYLESRLFGVERFDLFTFGAALTLIAAVSLAAAIVPALRAARVDPVVALRQ